MYRNSIRLVVVLAPIVLCLAPAGARAAAGGGGGGGIGSGGGGTVGRTAHSPEKDAERSYRRGLRERDSAWKHERRAEEATSEKKRNKSNARAAQDWHAAAEHYRKAIATLPRYPEAHASLGYALRKLGDYDASLASYNRALELKPGFPEALEYRAEAYLALGRLDDATRSYSKLEMGDREKAAQLLAAMEAWLENASRDGAPPATVTQRSPEWLREWVAAKKIALEELPLQPSAAQSTDAERSNRPVW